MTIKCNLLMKHGKIQLELFPQVAPKTVANFKNLVNSGFYDNRSVWGTGGPGWNIDAEFSDLKHSRGIVSMARSHDPNSAGSQFFIVLKDSYFLDGQYSIFGQVVEGMDVVDKIGSTRTDSNDAPMSIEDAKIMKIEVVE